MARTTLPVIGSQEVYNPHIRVAIDDEEIQTLANRYEHEMPPRPFSGTPTKYDPRFHPRVAFILCSEHGFTDLQLREVFGLPGSATLWSWKRRWPKLAQAIRDGRDLFAVHKVEAALNKRALGYDLVNRELGRVPIYESVLCGDGKIKNKIVGYEMAVVKETVTHIPPDVKAIMFILQNRQPARWKNVRTFEASGTLRHEHLHAMVPLQQALVEVDPTKLPTKVLAALIADDPSDPLMDEINSGPGPVNGDADYELPPEDYTVAEGSEHEE